jgi:hypothetical protein
MQPSRLLHDAQYEPRVPRSAAGPLRRNAPNGRAGVIRGFNATDTNRFVVRMDDDDGKEVSVKAENVERIRGDDYRRLAP